jgi:hypothetical protein
LTAAVFGIAGLVIGTVLNFFLRLKRAYSLKCVE